MIYPWKLNYWQTGEWQVCNERLKDLEKAGVLFNPARPLLFKALQSTRLEEVRVCILGQDPYPDHRMATGYAFSIPGGFSREEFPATLNQIFKEYCSDLGYEFPNSGDLSQWADQGVLLWNCIPSCRAGASLSHDWDEYSYLTREIVQRLSARGIVFVFLGSAAKRYQAYVEETNNQIILTSHPSPRGSRHSKTPFEGSRLFSTINSKLNSQGLDPIDWRLSDASTGKSAVQGASVVRGNILDNITGATITLLDKNGTVIR